MAARFPLPWSHYVRLLSVRNPEAKHFYGTEVEAALIEKLETFLLELGGGTCVVRPPPIGCRS